MEQFFATMFEDVQNERYLKLLLSLTHPYIFQHSKFTDHELNTIKNPDLEELHGHR